MGKTIKSDFIHEIEMVYFRRSMNLYLNLRKSSQALRP